jgi:hypothetical protein
MRNARGEGWSRTADARGHSLLALIAVLDPLEPNNTEILLVPLATAPTSIVFRDSSARARRGDGRKH